MISERLRAMLGEGVVLTAPADLAAYLGDGARTAPVLPACVVRPSSTRQVSEVVAACAEAGVSIVARGGGTGLAGGATPGQDCVVLSLERMRAVRVIDPVDDVIVVEAGCTLADAHRAVGEVGRQLGFEHGGWSSQIGGNLATNAGGNAVLRHGMARDQVLGIEAVLADGSVIGSLSPLRKSNAGYDLRQLLVGSEGTLGIITAVALKLKPRPVSRATALFAVNSLDDALQLLTLARDGFGEALSAFEVISRAALEFHLSDAGRGREPLATRSKWLALIEADSASPFFDLRAAMEVVAEAALTLNVVADGALATSDAQRQEFWSLREGVPAAFGRSSRLTVKTDMAVPVSRTPEFVARAESAAAAIAPGSIVASFGHLGDGNIHINVLPPAHLDDDAFRPLAECIHSAMEDAALALGGTVSAEHGIGMTKRASLGRMRSEREIALMRGIKALFDPGGIFNPDKVLPSEAECSSD